MRLFTGQCDHGADEHRSTAGYLQCVGLDWVRDSESSEMEFVEFHQAGVYWCGAAFSLFPFESEARRALRVKKYMCPAGTECLGQHELADFGGLYSASGSQR
ncbi:hypothetical protein G419_25242 [Rhodococcus triatomae BKS 15-14]|nr:hypothetical protein G419_25242 [Rhodococcus triatomae BKS 15-14]